MRSRLTALLPLLVSSVAGAQLPVSGKPVPQLAAFDQVMQNYLQEHSIEAGMLGVIKDGVIVYQRGFGNTLTASGSSRPLAENDLMRLASVAKPFTAAAIHKLADWGWLSLDQYAFDLGQLQGGILPHEPYDGLGTTWLWTVTVEHLLEHKGGWDSDIAGDPMGMPVQIAQALGVPSPASRDETLSYMLSQGVQHVPGAVYAYSNFGYMVLGLIVEEISGQSLNAFLREHVVHDGMWVPSTDYYFGYSLLGFQHPREPRYRYNENCTNVFAPSTSVNCAYGGVHLEAMVGHGNLVSNTTPILRMLDHYTVIGENIGKPHGGSPGNGSHAGWLVGSSTVATQRDDDIHIAVLLARSYQDQNTALDIAGEISDLIDGGTLTWPSASVDGYWVDFGPSASGWGGYDSEYTSLQSALAASADGTKLRFKPGSSGQLSVVIDTKLLLDAPMGSAVIGQ